MKITIIIPTYNEAENLPKIISALFLQNIPDLHILIVDDNSPDGTGKIADELAASSDGKLATLHRTKKEGLGRAYLHGYQVALDAGADAIIQMDADFSHPPEKIPEMIAEARTHEAVFGSRYVPGGNVDKHWSRWRKALSSFGNLYARTILQTPVRDITGGFRLYQRSLLERMTLSNVRSNGYVFQVEMGYLAYLKNATFKEIPIYFADRQWGHSKMSFRIQLEAAWRVWVVWFRYRDLRRAHKTNAR